MPGTKKLEKLTTKPGSDLRQLTIQWNNLVATVAAMQTGLTGDAILRWYGPGPNAGTAPMALGSTDTRVGTAAVTMSILGVPVVKAVDNAGTAFGALGTIPASTWGLIAFEVVAAGTVTYTSAAANYSSGYATEALAIAALPARITAKARMGYCTILASASGFVVGTDSPTGGASGNPATTTNYYPVTGICGPTGEAIGPNGTATAAQPATGNAWTGGKNGVQVASVLTIGSTDVRVATAAFTYNANGLTDIPKAAVTAGTAFGALGTIPINTWGLIVFLINGAGTVTYLSAPSNYTSGYQTEAQAIGDLNKIYPSSGLCVFAYCTIKTKVGTTFVVGTDSPLGGATGNVASATNYYPTPGITLGAGVTASQIAQENGALVTSANY